MAGREERIIDRDDVNAIFRALFDIRSELTRIRRAVEEDDGEEEEIEP